MQKKVLTEQSLYFGQVDMPKYFEIDRDELAHHILRSTFNNKDLIFSRTWDKLNTYIIDHVRVKYTFTLVKEKTWGDIYKPNQITIPLLNIDPVDLTHSPDYTLLYGVKAEECNVRIHYDDNRRAGRSWDIELKNNMFIMFPSTNMYYITNNQKDSLNFIQTTTYSYI
tara:strand:+ start:758 stop:1261 length:504 start_codon:yes stop_codon:yes gene_type:complete